ncbi:MAG: sulfotransferase domain-containing protein [Phenylobacterium sp.]
MSLIDHPLILRSNLARKLLAYALQAPRAIARSASSQSNYAQRPPILVNSIPKSGTHMLMQVARAIPNTSYYGSFVARTPSWSRTARSPSTIARLIRKATPGEVIGAHLPYDMETVAALASLNALHIFIYRDPRDVVISEANYLAKMNRWHSMHRVFSRLSSDEERIRTCIEGTSDPQFPNVNTRLIGYAPWLSTPGVISVRYEDLYGAKRDQEIMRIVHQYERQSGSSIDQNSLRSILNAIDPTRSHTFHSGGIEKWRTLMSEANQQLFRSTASPLLSSLGYQPQ